MTSPLASIAALGANASPARVADALSPPGTSPLANLLGDLDTRPTHTIPFPGATADADGVIPMVSLWALTDEEGRSAALAAHNYCVVTRKMTVEVAERLGILASENRVRILLAAMRRPEAPSFPLASPGEVGANEVRRLTPDVQDALMIEYLRHLDARSPLRRLQADGLNDHVEELVTELGKGVPVSALTSSYDTGTLQRLVEFLLLRVAGIKGSSWDSSPPNDGPSSSSDLSAAGTPSAGDDDVPDDQVIDARG